MIVIARDTKRNRWELTVEKIITDDGKRILSFGYPIQYYLDSKVGLLIHYPFEEDLCIDLEGKHFKTDYPPVTVSKEQINKLLEEL